MNPLPPRKVAKRITGPAHILAATTYSVAGLKRLWRETAFRHEILSLAACAALLFWIGASAVEFCVLLGLFLLVVGVEALNTALECLADRIAPGWDEHARDAKDLGSLAVTCTLLITGLFMAATVWRHLT